MTKKDYTYRSTWKHKFSRARNKVYYFILNNSKEVPKKPEISQIIREKLYNYLKKESKLFPSLIAAREIVNLFLKNELKIP